MQRPPENRRATFLPFSRPVIEQDEIDEVSNCLRSGWITSGPQVVRFEQSFRDRLNAPHAIAVSSATAGLHLVLHALGIGKGDEVIVPALTWPATANVVELLGADAILADVDPTTLQLDPDAVGRALSPRTRAIMPVHFAGAPVDLAAIRKIVSGRDIFIIEDAAHALGTRFQGREIGSDSFAAVFSFHPTKNMTTGEGGMIMCRDDQIADRIRRLRAHGVSKDAWRRYGQGQSPRYDVIEPGYKYNLTDIHASIGLCQIAKLDRFNTERARLAARYGQLLAGVPGVTPIGLPSYDHHHSWHLYVVRLTLGPSLLDRDSVVAAMADRNIGTGLHFMSLEALTYYAQKADDRRLGTPRATKASNEILSLPLYPGLSDQDLMDVVAALSGVLGTSTQNIGVAN
jgi:UDP-4-amino-4-deoxy-L-arabinose-oxoglutarate aminotransferase